MHHHRRFRLLLNRRLLRRLLSCACSCGVRVRTSSRFEQTRLAIRTRLANSRIEHARFEHALRLADYLVHPFAAGTTAKVSSIDALSNRIRSCDRAKLRFERWLRSRRQRFERFTVDEAALSKVQCHERQRLFAWIILEL